VDVRAGETRVLWTHRLTPKQYLEAPLEFVDPDKYAPRPWISLELLGRRPRPGEPANWGRYHVPVKGSITVPAI